MFISKIEIENFRNFKKSTIQFNNGINIVIGHNNSGKTNLLKALQIVFDRQLRGKPTMDDFNKEYADFQDPPSIRITVTISEGNEEPEDKNVVYEWLVKESPLYEAQLTYVFYLPYKHLDEYRKECDQLKDENGQYKREECLRLIEKKFYKKYVSKIFGGDPSREEIADPENLNRFDFQFLNALRDAEREMFYGNNTLLRDVLNYFLDYDISKGRDFEGLNDKEKEFFKKREAAFMKRSRSLLSHLKCRITKDKMLEYSKETGADKGGIPNFDSGITEQDMLFALRLIVEKSGFKSPIKNNGLGYNNLLFIALILSKMQMERSAFMGDNAKVFPIMVIEEPEAHLHPSMQFKFLRFLENNLNTQKQARQIFISSHSTHITSAVDLDSIICLYDDINGAQRVGYPGRVFSESAEGKASKVYVKRFLDATKSNMLFANRVIFVEGISEQLLLPCFALYLGKEEMLLNEHICIVSVDSRTFHHFLKIFEFNVDTKPDAINKKVVCIIDADPTKKQKKQKKQDGTNRRSWKACFPYEIGTNTDEFEYQSLSSNAKSLIESSQSFENIEICTPTDGEGKTLEYEIAINNPACTLLITDNFPSQGKHRKGFFKEIMEAYGKGKPLCELISLCDHEEITELIESSCWDDAKRSIALIASIYYEAIEGMKGEYAFYLEKLLRDNYSDGDPKQAFSVPPYIQRAVEYITG